MSGVPSTKGDVVLPLGSLVSTGSLRPVCWEPSLRRGTPIWGKFLLWGSCGPFFRLLSEEWGGLAYIRLAGGLQREMGLGYGDLCEGEGSPCWWRG